MIGAPKEVRIIDVEQKYTLLGKIFCKWLKLHIRDKSQTTWGFEGQSYSICRLCHMVYSVKPPEREG
jgi:hypothetical protein